MARVGFGRLGLTPGWIRRLLFAWWLYGHVRPRGARGRPDPANVSKKVARFVAGVAKGVDQVEPRRQWHAQDWIDGLEVDAVAAPADAATRYMKPFLSCEPNHSAERSFVAFLMSAIYSSSFSWRWHLLVAGSKIVKAGGITFQSKI
ncbi:hypothetical protein CR103_16090 [Massilia psychrophila]|uniref:Uncharacterized protein n=1 Tax=Massilia psychrophila TaxID=1603353 RepID=A0A2G8SYK7_9BURK|nr:hypothetical protein CR103_16090 [Massilia psychrophila]